MSGRSSNIPIIIVTQLAWMVFQIGAVCAFTFGAEWLIGVFGYEATYTNRPIFLNALALFVGLPALLWIMEGVLMFQIELEAARDAELQARRVEPAFFETINNRVSTLDGDSRARLIENIRRDLLP